MPLNKENKQTYIKNPFPKNVLLTDPTKKVRIIIYDTKFKTSNLIISNDSTSSTELIDRTNVLYMFKCLLGYCVSNKNNMYLGLISTTLSRCLILHLIDSNSIAQYLKSHSIPKSKFRKILVENTTLIAHEINKLRLQI